MNDPRRAEIRGKVEPEQLHVDSLSSSVRAKRAALTRSSKPTKRGGALLCAISEESHLRVEPQLVSVGRAGGAGAGVPSATCVVRVVPKR